MRRIASVVQYFNFAKCLPAPACRRRDSRSHNPVQVFSEWTVTLCSECLIQSVNKISCQLVAQFHGRKDACIAFYNNFGIFEDLKDWTDQHEALYSFWRTIEITVMLVSFTKWQQWQCCFFHRHIERGRCTLFIALFGNVWSWLYQFSSWSRFLFRVYHPLK